VISGDSDRLPVLGQEPSGSYEPPEVDGWTTRTTTDEPRLSELVELYQELGFEVMLRPVSSVEADGTCSVCVMDDPERYKTIYTRPKIED
jgi:hypothetical protein